MVQRPSDFQFGVAGRARCTACFRFLGDHLRPLCSPKLSKVHTPRCSSKQFYKLDGFCFQGQPDHHRDHSKRSSHHFLFDRSCRYESYIHNSVQHPGSPTFVWISSCYQLASLHCSVGVERYYQVLNKRSSPDKPSNLSLRGINNGITNPPFLAPRGEEMDLRGGKRRLSTDAS